MQKFICENKRCKHEFYSSENKKVLKCPCCNEKVYNMSLIVNENNCFYIDTVLKNIKHYGKIGVFDAIDRIYHKAIQRVGIRALYNQTIKELEED